MNNLYLKGFNHGYLLAKDLPKEFEKYMMIGNNESEYGKGFGDGAMLGQKERLQHELTATSKKKESGKGKEI